jgi:hypothetical protein
VGSARAMALAATATLRASPIDTDATLEGDPDERESPSGTLAIDAGRSGADVVDDGGLQSQRVYIIVVHTGRKPRRA